MERTLEVACDGAVSSFVIRKLSRATLHGTRRRVPVDAEGRECKAAALTRDGRFLLSSGRSTGPRDILLGRLLYLQPYQRSSQVDRG